MRLIDSDEFKEIILTYGKAGYRALLIEKISELIDSQSTAYDVDKVVERLEENNFSEDWTNDVIYTEDAVKIVKSGGMD